MWFGLFFSDNSETQTDYIYQADRSVRTVCGCWLAGIVMSNPIRDMEFCLL
jgi:hypothetical protein